jgi:muramoyltetrapeptide carboxypeptidase
MNKNYWPQLQPGDLIDVIAPAMAPSKKSILGLDVFLKSWGLKVRYSKSLVSPDLLCSNTKEFRQNDLKRALLAKDSKMVWCLRGGYGSIHLLDQLNKLKRPQTKIFMGFSDTTNLHLLLNQKWGWATIHGCHIGRFSTKEASQNEEKRVKDLLFGKVTKLKYKIKALNSIAKKDKKINSQILGGNLVNIQSTLGTDFQLIAKNKILFFEEIDERAYKIDRIFQHMKMLNFFKDAKAIIFGQFTGGREPSGNNLVPIYLKKWAQEQKIPIYSGIQSGHGANQFPLPLNTKVMLKGGISAFIEIETGVNKS